LGVPVANVALRFSPVGRAVLPAEQKRSSEAFLAFFGAAVLALVLGVVVSASFAVGLIPLVLLAFVVGNAHDLKRRTRRIVYVSAITAGVAAFAAGALGAAAGAETAGLVLFGGAIVAGIVLLWVVRLG
jgi:hypothetical protein